MKKRGFAGMPVEKRLAIAASGGRKAHAMGVAHRYTSAEAKHAGAKGGRAGKGKKKLKAK